MQISDYIDKELSIREHRFVDWIKLKTDLHVNGAYNGSWLGTYSLTTACRSLTLISNYHTWCGLPVSAASISRRILSSALKVHNRQRFNWNKSNFALLQIPQPLYCSAYATKTFLYYADITSAYWQIYRSLPTLLYFGSSSCQISGERFYKVLPTDLASQKLVRNSLVGCFRATTCLKVEQTKIVSRPTRNNLLSPSHWGFMAHLLHRFAAYAIDFGAIYYNTDGAIFDDRIKCDRWISFMRSLGFSIGIKAEGLGCVWGVGRYSIGKATMPKILPPCLPFNNLLDLSDRSLELWEKIR